MSPPPYMRMYWGNYFRQTKHLNRSQHGAYLMLISSLWSNGGKLPADDATLASHALCTPDEWAQMKAIILPFFDIRRGKLSNRKVTEELAHYKTIVGNRKSAGKAGAKVTNEKRKRNSAASADGLPPKPEPEPESSLEASYKASSTTRRERPEAHLDGASSLRVIEGGPDLTERGWLLAAAEADAEMFRIRRTDPDHASDLAEFIAYAKAEAIRLRRSAA